jgi:hypothetical protein
MRRLILVWSLLCFNLFAFCQDQGAPSVVDININISRSVPAVNYQTNSSIRIDFKGTPLLLFAVGNATVDNKNGLMSVDASLSKMSAPAHFGPEFPTDVLWAITPEGRASILGDIQLTGDKAKLGVTIRLPSFAPIAAESGGRQ